MEELNLICRSKAYTSVLEVGTPRFLARSQLTQDWSLYNLSPSQPDFPWMSQENFVSSCPSFSPLPKGLGFDRGFWSGIVDLIVEQTHTVWAYDCAYSG